MGSEVGESQPTSLKDYFDELCAYALSIGMSFQEFWEDSVDKLIYYHKAEQFRIRKKNEELWLMGLYVYNAVGNLAPILNMGVKDHKAKPYMKQPIPITEEERIEQENQRVSRFANYMDGLVKKGEMKDGN